jgi:CubicO group peptidase (beta-lactamase class C family)
MQTKESTGLRARTSRLAVLALMAAMGACSTRDGVTGTLLPGTAGSVPEAAMIDQAVARDLETDVRRTMRKEGIQGMAISVVARDGSGWTAGFGSAGGDRPVTPETPFTIASVTKLFTAVTVMTLVEDGLVDLDSPIGVYVPEMAGASYPGSPQPTVRDLLTHHGGLASDLLTGNLYSGPASGYSEAFMDLVSVVSREPLTEPPRTIAHYSNLGYLLLGALVANVSGMSYVEYVERRVLEPLGMSGAGFADPATDTRGSAGFAAGKEVTPLRMSGLPEGGLAASAADLGRFVSMILAEGEPVLGASALAEMMRRQNGDVALDFDFEMGLGFHLMTLPGHPDVRLAWHDGGTHPFASTLVVAPDRGVGAVILSNTDEKVPAEIARIRVVFREIGGRRVLAYYEDGKFRSAALAIEPQPVPVAWERRYGSYTAVSPDPDPFFLGAELGFDAALGFMILKVRVASSPTPFVIPVVATDETTLATAGLGRHMGETLRAEQGEDGERIHWAGLVLRRS